MIGAVESYYGEPLSHVARLDLVRWLGAHSFNAYAYGPKDDPYHRERWREPYPDDRLEELRQLIDVGSSVGIDVGLMLSPGLDWQDGDEDALIAKMRSLAALGARGLSIAWDDVPVPPGSSGAELGAVHGRAIAAAHAAIDTDAYWMSVPIDYAGSVVTPYLRAFCDALPDDVGVAWTGPGIVSTDVPPATARSLASELGRKLLFADNFPVNDGPMSGTLHLGPYPQRDPALIDEVSGVFFNFMPNKPIASRVGLGCAAAWWDDPTSDREQTWIAIVRSFPGLEPLARACRSWVSDPSPDPQLVSMGADGTLLAWLIAGCRDGLDPALEAEVEPWLDQWEWEGMALQCAMLTKLLGGPMELKFITASFWQVARRTIYNTFGIRLAMYPVTNTRVPPEGQGFETLPEALVVGENLTDTLCREAINP
jgi:hypothetical protein